ncbi:hypothetical protein KY290_002139 [Solanum tuberosum]|uniref:Pentatricopeptide repeat-containing protein n=1 Tax=Solanum tuberosum TaxID=4113 RepID=A0ABQ7WP72_SOLTU|nr:hypothetical protein KY289_004375 [Solanum tuberosum]KAH0782541.1 hypothetical protein KY290_002139 [Solanum tuberosum]
MLLQPTTTVKPPHQKTENYVSFSSSLSYSLSFPSGFCNLGGFTKPLMCSKNHHSVISCSSTPQVHGYGTVDYERRPIVKWNAIYKRISMNDGPERGSVSVLNQWENEGKKVTKWELSRVIKELRKFRRYKLAFEVYEWMNNRPERFRLTTSDTAIQLDLIAKVHGISSAEEYFEKLPDTLKDKRIYGSLLNAFVRSRKKEQAESLLDKMRNRGYTDHALPFNVMMTLYMNLKDYDKVESVVSEMKEKKIPLDIYSYNIWLSSCGSQGSIEKMEKVLEQMNLDTDINPNWTTFSTMATMYIKLGELKKAEDSLKSVESRITGRDRIPYHYLISLYGSLGKKEEVLRIWKTYQSQFPNIPNLGYHSVISSLVRLDDIEGAEKIYDEWLPVKVHYDPRIGNLLLGYYVRKGFVDKASAFFDQMIGAGGKPNSMTCEILAEGHIRDRRISEALSCLKDAVSTEGSKSWRPKPATVSSILRLCEQEDDTQNKEALLEVLKQVGCLNDEKYMSYIPLSNGTITSSETEIEKDTSDNNEGSDILLNQLQESL